MRVPSLRSLITFRLSSLSIFDQHQASWRIKISAHATHISEIHRRRYDPHAVRLRQAHRHVEGDRSDPGRHARPERRHQVRDPAAHPAGHAPGGDDHDAGRQAGRLLRDLDAAVPAADPAGGHARHDRLGLWGGQVGQQEGAADPPRALAHDRGDMEAAGADQVDQRAGGRQRQLPAAPAARGPDAALGEPAAGERSCLWDRSTRFAADVHLDARPLHRPGADRDAPPRRGRGRRRERRLRRGLVPARPRTTSPAATPPRAPGTTSSRARRPRSSPSTGGRASRPSSTRTTSASRRSGTTTTRSA